MKNLKLILLMGLICVWCASGAVTRGKTYTASELNRAWKGSMNPILGLDTPESYRLIDIDGDGCNEVLMQGGGMKMVFMQVKGYLSFLVRCFGEFESIKASADGVVCYTEESGRSANEFTKYYYHLKNSRLQSTMIHTVICDDDNEDVTTTSYYVNGNKVTAKEAGNYLPKAKLKDIFNTGKWIPIKQKRRR